MLTVSSYKLALHSQLHDRLQMSKNFSLMEDSNRSSNLSIHDVSDPSRRQVLRGGLGALASSFLHH